MRAKGKDRRLIEEIAERAVRELNSRGPLQPFEKAQVMMDLTACHLNSCPLKLKELLKGEPGHFVHDIGGIRRHLNRKTGKLENCFVPRYAQPEAADG